MILWKDAEGEGMRSEKAKRVKKALAIIAVMFIIFLAITFVTHRIMLSKEKQMLTVQAMDSAMIQRYRRQWSVLWITTVQR